MLVEQLANNVFDHWCGRQHERCRMTHLTVCIWGWPALLSEKAPRVMHESFICTATLDITSSWGSEFKRRQFLLSSQHST
jgi:hypothetical protein